jgi:hypothetical protein
MQVFFEALLSVATKLVANMLDRMIQHWAKKKSPNLPR